MKTTTWLLVPLALATTHCLIELSPSATDLHAPTPLPARDAAAADAAADAGTSDAGASDVSASDAAPTPLPVRDADASADGSTSI